MSCSKGFAWYIVYQKSNQPHDWGFHTCFKRTVFVSESGIAWRDTAPAIPFSHFNICIKTAIYNTYTALRASMVGKCTKIKTQTRSNFGLGFDRLGGMMNRSVRAAAPHMHKIMLSALLQIVQPSFLDCQQSLLT